MNKVIALFIAIVLFFNCSAGNSQCLGSFLDSVNAKVLSVHDGRYHVVFNFSGQNPPIDVSYEGTGYFSHDSATIGSIGDFIMFEKDTIPTFGYMGGYFYKFDAARKQYTRQFLRRQNFFQKTTFDFQHFTAVYYLLVNLQYPFDGYFDEQSDSSFCNKNMAGFIKTDTLRSTQQPDQFRKSQYSVRRTVKTDSIEITNIDIIAGNTRKRQWIIDSMKPVKKAELYVQKKINQFAAEYQQMEAEDLDDKKWVEPVIVPEVKKLLLDTVPVNTVLKTMEYKPYSMDKPGSKLLVLDFWFANCRPCLEAMPKLESLYNTYRSKGLAVIGINAYDYDMDILKGILKRTGVDYDICLDSESELTKALGINTFPQILIVDPTSKKIISSYSGVSDFAIIQNQIDTLLKDK
jgi:thiol-disulfide isomerase/thioredoxin